MRVSKNNIKFYIVFHGNLAFSSIEEDKIEEIIEKCYYPLLEIILVTKTKVGVELSGYTLEKIFNLKPNWINELKKLINNNLVEFIGSGYQQIIGPLVPYKVNIKNQELGFDTYQKILGLKPKIAFLNEQVFSKSMVDVHKNFYEAMFMEWNNVYYINSNKYSESYGFYPILAKGIKQTIPILWTNSILFQQFQRTVHNQNSLKDYLETIKRFIKKGYQCLPIYASDLEIFNYRPGRFNTEASIFYNEWKNIFEIFKTLKNIGEFLLPSEILKKFLKKDIELELSNASFPIVVKKQPKYTLSRWSAAGKGATLINTLCYNFYNQIKNKNKKNLWKTLITYWGSDFRTHTTQNKWEKAISILKNYQNFNETRDDLKEKPLVINGNKIIIHQGEYKFTFLAHKGLALESVFKNNQRLPFGTLNHGELDYITHGADYYTGTSTIESQEGRLSNLTFAQNISYFETKAHESILSGEIKLGPQALEKKEWVINLDSKTLTLKITLNLSLPIKASIRLGTITLLPVIKTRKFWYSCRNGGKDFEKFFIEKDTIVTHHLPISVLQSSNGGLGATEGDLIFGVNNKKIVKITIDNAFYSPLLLLQNTPDSSVYLTRVFFSVQELDDTLNPTLTNFKLKYSIQL
jgi:hypothetical protein